MTPDQSQHAIEALAPFSTAQLVEALKAREGVERCFVEPDEKCSVEVWTEPKVIYRQGGMHEAECGPCVILKVTD